MSNDMEQKIIETAIKLFSEKGYAATSIRDIAKEVEMTSASLYYYIKSKKDLLNLIMDRYLCMLITDAKKELSQVEDKGAHEKLKALIRNHVLSHGFNSLAALVVDTEYRSIEGENKEQVRKLRDQYEELWSIVLKEGKEAGEFTINNTKITSYALISLCTGVAHWYREDGELSIEEIAEQYAMLGLKMVLA